MTLSNEQQNLINDLKAPIKSFRIFALEEAIKSGAAPEVLNVLYELKAEESDGECQMLIAHAISAVEARLSGAEKKPAKKIKEQEDFFEQWNAADETEKMRILTQLPARLPASIKGLGPELLAMEKSPVLGSKIIRVFCRHWPEEKFNAISDLLRSQSLSLRLAALRTIVHMKPELLLDDLPSLLRSEDPQIKALAIRGLAKIDKEEALNHLQALLLSSTLSDRLSGIQNCPFLPFEMVKPVLLKYFAAENHPELLIRAGWILEMNPDIQVPFKLYEIAERSPAKKAELVKGILNESVKLLEKSGILGDQFPLYTRKLQLWVSKRNALRFARQLVPRLEADPVPYELDQLIRAKLGQPFVLDSFNEALSWPISDKVKQRFSSYIEDFTLNKSDKATRPSEPVHSDSASAKDFNKESVSGNSAQNQEQNATKQKLDISSIAGEDCITLLASFDKAQAEQNLDRICQLVTEKDSSSEIKIAAIHCLTRFKLGGLEGRAEKLVMSNDIPVATAAVEYLGEVDPERVFPYLGKCLNVADVAMKSAALGILKNFDYNQAVSSLNAMLASSDPEQQRMALECMDQFDFSLIREQLTDFLEKCNNEEVVEAGLCLFAANPSPENVYSLYKIEQAHGGAIGQVGKIAGMARKLRAACEQSAVDTELRQASQEKTEVVRDEDLNQKYKEEQEKKKKARPAYAYREIAKKQPVTLKENIRAIGVSLKEVASSKSSYIALIILILTGVGFYVFFVPNEGPDPHAGRGTAVVSGQYLREGTIKRVAGTAVEFESTRNEKFVFHPIRDGYRLPEVGKKLRVSLVPYRKNPDGSYLSRIRAMREIEAFSDDQKAADR
ncbi:MAG: hypothetical protein Kow0029_09250 [Candidatus Rifleibacteriota bacterium]